MFNITAQTYRLISSVSGLLYVDSFAAPGTVGCAINKKENTECYNPLRPGDSMDITFNGNPVQDYLNVGYRYIVELANGTMLNPMGVEIYAAPGCGIFQVYTDYPVYKGRDMLDVQPTGNNTYEIVMANKDGQPTRFFDLTNQTPYSFSGNPIPYPYGGASCVPNNTCSSIIAPGQSEIFKILPGSSMVTEYSYGNENEGGEFTVITHSKGVCVTKQENNIPGDGPVFWAKETAHIGDTFSSYDIVGGLSKPTQTPMPSATPMPSISPAPSVRQSVSYLLSSGLFASSVLGDSSSQDETNSDSAYFGPSYNEPSLADTPAWLYWLVIGASIVGIGICIGTILCACNQKKANKTEADEQTPLNNMIRNV